MAKKPAKDTKKPAAKAAAKPAAKAAAAKPAKAASKPAVKAPAKLAKTAKPARKPAKDSVATAATKVAGKAVKAAGAALKAAGDTAKTAAKTVKAAVKPAAKKPAMTLSVIKPSVNNLAVRIFARAAKLGVEEADAYGATRSPEFLAKNPAHLTPMLEDKGLPRRALWESCAIMQYLANKHKLEKFYPSKPAQRAMVDSAMFYLVGTLYPYVARATYPALGFPQYPGEVGASDLEAGHKTTAQKAAEAAIAEPLEVFHSFFRNGKAFIGGSHPSIADIRLAATLEFLAVIDYALPKWAKDYMASMEKKLGKAYSEPAADVRGYIGYVKSKAAA